MSVTSVRPRLVAGRRLPNGGRGTQTHHRRALLEGAAVVVLAAVVIVGQLWALKAAGLTVAEPSGGESINGRVATLQANWEGLVMTGVGLALAIVAGLVIFGSQRAPEHVFRIAGGIVMLIVVIPAVLA